MEEWIKDVTRLSEFEIPQPQASYVTYTFGLKHRWTYFIQTLPGIQDLLQPLQNAIAKVFLPVITEHECTRLERQILAQPVGKGGLGITNPCEELAREYTASIHIKAPPVERITSQTQELPADSRIQILKKTAKKGGNDALNEKVEILKNAAS